MKNYSITYKIFSSIAILSIFGIAACSTASQSVVTIPTEVVVTEESIQTINVDLNPDNPTSTEELPVDLIIVDTEGSTSIDPDLLATAMSSTSSGVLSESEVEGLVYMREEEKLARDVYLTLFDQWNMNIFQNIAKSEQTHTDAVKNLLDIYGIVDPVINDEIGKFVNPDLQALYDQLVVQGSQSLGDALKVGAAIEEIDILDLEKHIAQTEHTNIQTVYNSLLKGSRNHLRTFVSTLQVKTGETYQPQFLTQEGYELIINASIETGNQEYGKGNR
ncbi:MAG: DUF2202 domain-containing protein [Chloroflexota bacterium]